jgi:hypothetical protein
VGLAWRGLRDGQRYLGGVRYDQPDGTAAGVTLLAVEPGAAATVLRQGDVMAHKTARLKALRAR